MAVISILVSTFYKDVTWSCGIGKHAARYFLKTPSDLIPPNVTDHFDSGYATQFYICLFILGSIVCGNVMHILKTLQSKIVIFLGREEGGNLL